MQGPAFSSHAHSQSIGIKLLQADLIKAICQRGRTRKDRPIQSRHHDSLAPNSEPIPNRWVEFASNAKIIASAHYLSKHDLPSRTTRKPSYS